MFAMTRCAKGLTLSVSGVYNLPAPATPSILPNAALFSQAESIADAVLVDGLPACVMPGRLASSQGDEAAAGGGGGVISGRVGAHSQVVRGSQIVFFGGKPVVRLCDNSMHNSNNSPGFTLGPTQTLLMIEA
ncbi:PAAR-like domain-containing protein [Variovorax saccharolyticus]|uniref:PAAR-like domain-containing protein n=1 Tax=Variovorax saccharolyticus TaxID=3053516 RepID=UPI00257777B4|nr:PAAR-like domain-containing protein [Variovorax sp. J31P216]MDM0030342.1 DUF4150 domain-containing protein [Variovorax sp. J31P216]